MLHSRKRRAAPSDIYRHCKIFGTCPPDVINKYEQNTFADKILKYGGAGVFLGSLGISSVGGSGGRYGYVPLGSAGTGVRIGGSRVSTLRPGLPISTLGPHELLPVDAVNPLDPVLPPRLPEVYDELDLPPVRPSGRPQAYDELPPLQPPRPAVIDEDLPFEEIPLTETTPSGPTSTAESSLMETSFTISPDLHTPKVTLGGESDAAVLEVIPETRAPRLITRSQYSNPTFEVAVHSSAGSGEVSASDNIFVHGDTGGQIVGEEIQLAGFTRGGRIRAQDQETSFMTSTPSRVEPYPARSKALYGPRVQQIPVSDSAFLGRVQSLVTFDNPAFEDSVDLIFQQELENVARAAPAEEFRDLATLSKPIYSRNPEGGVRVSRLGQKHTMKTRSGLFIGPKAHYFHDISDIPPVESVDLSTFSIPGERSGEAIIELGDEFEEISLDSIRSFTTYPDDELLDYIEPIADNLQLVIGNKRSPRPFNIPNFFSSRPAVFPDFTGVTVHSSNSGAEKKELPLTPIDIPAIILDVLNDVSGGYFLHPSLLRKRRKRDYLFFSDGGVVTSSE
ncbi:L2 [Leptonychotes weddellii papillomavirus 1]|uniref:Minor capsid protein L2 n=1 Tax=Leptonychotes weddellii papillomavirus 1 TaxID=2077302 RepID=A0A2I8B2S5_9PAPI|nr:L2 [Leptonychotes weddellii papillomavirus 1]AUT11899.1 L2 [Leptonychotes weddellii papillomavirus 1]